MKKLMIAAAIVCAAAMSQAATVAWKETKTAIYSHVTAKSLTKGTVTYLLQSTAAYGREELLADFVTAGSTAAFESTVAGKAAMSTTLNSDKQISTTQTGITKFTAATENAYFVIFDGDNMYLSEVASADYASVDDKYSFTFTSQTNPSKAAVHDAAAGLDTTYAGAGWYTVSDVPEPTSGLLLLLGVAGLALRRRRA